jgi:hypothetical protein
MGPLCPQWVSFFIVRQLNLAPLGLYWRIGRDRKQGTPLMSVTLKTPWEQQCQFLRHPENNSASFDFLFFFQQWHGDLLQFFYYNVGDGSANFVTSVCRLMLSWSLFGSWLMSHVYQTILTTFTLVQFPSVTPWAFLPKLFWWNKYIVEGTLYPCVMKLFTNFSVKFISCFKIQNTVWSLINIRLKITFHDLTLK